MKVSCLVGSFLLVILALGVLTFTDHGCHQHAVDGRIIPNPLDVADLQRLSPIQHVLSLDHTQRNKLRGICKSVAEAYSNEQVEVLHEWRRKLPEMLEMLTEDDLGEVWYPIVDVAKNELHVKLNKILGKESIEEDFANVEDFKHHAEALIEFSLLYGDIMLRRKDFGVPFKMLEASVFCRLKSYRDGFRSSGRMDMEKIAEHAISEWVGQIESENGYVKALLVYDIAWLRVRGEQVMADYGKSWEEVSQNQVQGTIHMLTWAGYTPKWLDEFKVIPRHVTTNDRM